MQFVHSFRLAQISGAVGGNGQFDGHSRWLYFLFGFFEGEWMMGKESRSYWYIWRKLYTNEGLKVSATIATIATIAKRVFLAERIDDIEIQVYRRFSWLVIKHS